MHLYICTCICTSVHASVHLYMHLYMHLYVHTCKPLHLQSKMNGTRAYICSAIGQVEMSWHGSLDLPEGQGKEFGGVALIPTILTLVGLVIFSPQPPSRPLSNHPFSFTRSSRTLQTLLFSTWQNYPASLSQRALLVSEADFCSHTWLKNKLFYQRAHIYSSKTI
jgi:hypothetical protein